jgi:hypothetical protein
MIDSDAFFMHLLIQRLCIYGPVQDSNSEWRVRTNQEEEALMKEENIVRFINSQRLAWYDHVQGGSNMTGTNCDLFTHKSSRSYLNHLVNRMEDNKNVKAIMKWNPIDRRPRGRPKTRWKDDVEADLRAMKIRN